MNIFKKWYLGHRLRVLYKRAGTFRVVSKINPNSKKLEYHAQYRGTYIEDGEDGGWLPLTTQLGVSYVYPTLVLAEACIRKIRYRNVKLMRSNYLADKDAKYRKSQEKVSNV